GHGEPENEETKRRAAGSPPPMCHCPTALRLKTTPQKEDETRGQQGPAHSGKPAVKPEGAHRERGKRLGQPKMLEAHADVPVVDHRYRHGCAAIEGAGGNGYLQPTGHPGARAARRRPRGRDLEGRDALAVDHDPQVPACIDGRSWERAELEGL